MHFYAAYIEFNIAKNGDNQIDLIKGEWLSGQLSMSEMLRSTATSNDDKEGRKNLMARAWSSPKRDREKPHLR